MQNAKSGGSTAQISQMGLELGVDVDGKEFAVVGFFHVTTNSKKKCPKCQNTLGQVTLMSIPSIIDVSNGIILEGKTDIGIDVMLEIQQQIESFTDTCPHCSPGFKGSSVWLIDQLTEEKTGIPNLILEVDDLIYEVYGDISIANDNTEECPKCSFIKSRIQLNSIRSIHNLTEERDVDCHSEEGKTVADEAMRYSQNQRITCNCKN